MNLHAGSRARAAIILVLAAALASVTASGAVASARDASAYCVYYEAPYKQEVLVIDANGDAHCVPAAEAAAIAEAAGWPNFDPTDMTQEIAQYEARQEAAGWPNYDSTAIGGASTVAGANGPRMTQIAANTTAPYAGSANQRSTELTESREASPIDAASGAPFAARRSQVDY